MSRVVWDLPVRIIHWALVLAVAGSWLTQNLEGDWFRFHVWCGYAVLALTATRVLWGIVGTRHARFAAFVRGPRAVLRYAGSLARNTSPPHVGHNPLGGWMIVLLLVLLAAQAITGLFANDQIMNTGPLFGYVSAATSDRLTSLHEQLIDVFWIALALHVLAALYYLTVRRENLIVPMFTGRKDAAIVPADQAITTSRTWLAVLLLAGVATTIAVVVRNAPEASLSFF